MQVQTNHLDNIYKQASKKFNLNIEQVEKAFRSQFSILNEDIKEKKFNIIRLIHLGTFRPHIKYLYYKSINPIPSPGESDY